MEAYFRDRIDHPPAGIDEDAVRYDRHLERSRRKNRTPATAEEWDRGRREFQARSQSGTGVERDTLKTLGIQNNNDAKDATGTARTVLS